MASLNLAHRWCLGYALDEELPDHSGLTRIRQRLGVEIFQSFFKKAVDLCQDAGLVWGLEIYFDATKVEANADLDSLVPRLYYAAKTHVADLFCSVVAEGSGEGERQAPERELPEEIVRLLYERAASGPPGTDDPPWRLLEERRLDPGRRAAWSYQRTSAWHVSPTDPDATPMRTGNGMGLGYHDNYVVDCGKGRIILAAFVTPADVMESVPLRDLLRRVRFRRKLRPHQATGDTTYGPVQNVVALEDTGSRAYVPLPDFDHRTPYYGHPASLTTLMPTPFAAHRGNSCNAARPSTPKRKCAAGLTPRRATPALSGPSALGATAAAWSTAPPTPITPKGCGATTRPSRTRRRCLSARSGASRSWLRPGSGMGYGGPDSAAWRSSTWRACRSRRAST